MANSQRRMVYTKVWTSEQFGRLSDKAKLLYIGSITLADDDGRLLGNPAYLRGQIFPYEENLVVTDALRIRDEVVKTGLLVLYKGENESEILAHPKWSEYQIIRSDMYKKSKYPSPKTAKMNRNGTVTEPLQKCSLSQVKLSKDKLNIAEASSATVFDLKKEIQTLEDAPRREFNVIALYFTERKVKFDTLAQFRIAVKRHLRAAMSLKEFSNADILKAIDFVKVKYPEWTLETIIKQLTK